MIWEKVKVEEKAAGQAKTQANLQEEAATTTRRREKASNSRVSSETQ